MSDLVEAAWQQVAGERPRLRPELETACHRYRDRDWQVLHDPLSGRTHRMPVAGYRFASLLDGERTVAQALHEAHGQLGGHAPDRAEAVEIVGRLANAGLTADALEDSRRSAGVLARALMNPLAVRIPVCDPDRLLRALAPLASPLFGRVGLSAWLLLVGAGLVAAVLAWPELVAHFRSQSLAPATVAMVAAAYVAMKALHELGHGLAARVWGGAVHEVGVQLIVFLPLPYVDASASTAFPDKRRRLAVCAAGVGVELALAAAAVLVWTQAEPGAVRDLALNVALIGGVSTLLFNGNPLLRFDGYHVLCELVEIPGLGSRSARYWRHLAARYLLGVRTSASPASAPGETPWLAGYGLASGIYRWVIAAVIVWFVAGAYPVVGVVLAAWAAAALVGTPIVQLVRYLHASPVLAGRRGAASVRAGAAIAALGLVLGAVPVPYASRVEGVVWPTDDAQVRVEADGFVAEVLAGAGQRVTAGQPLLRLEAPLLDARIDLLAARHAELEASLAVEAFGDRVRAASLRDAIAALDAEIALAHEQRSRMTARSPAAGTFVPLAARDLLGRHLRQGERVGVIAEGGATIVRTAVPQDVAGLIRERPGPVGARFAGDLGAVLDVRIREEVPAALSELPSRVLGTAGGGAVPVDRADGSGVRTLVPVFHLVLEVPAVPRAAALGQRVHLRFDHGLAPLGQQWWRAARQAFLGRLGGL